MIRSKITLHDENYWDRLHTTVEVADWVSDLIARGVRTGCGVEDLMRTLSTQADPALAAVGLGTCARPPAS